MPKIYRKFTINEALAKNGYDIVNNRIFSDGNEWGLVKSDHDKINMRVLVNRYGPIEIRVIKLVTGQVNPIPKKNVQSDKWFAMVINEQVSEYRQESCNVTIYDGGEKMRELAFPEDRKRVFFKGDGIVHDTDTDTDFVEVTPYIRHMENVRTFINKDVVFRIIGDYSYRLSKDSAVKLNNGKQLTVRKMYDRLSDIKRSFNLMGGISLNNTFNEIMKKMKNIIIIYRDGTEKTVSLIHKNEAEGEIDFPIETLIELATKEHHSEDYQIDVYFLEDYQADPWIKRFVSICNKFRKAGKHVESGFYNPDRKRILEKNQTDK